MTDRRRLHELVRTCVKQDREFTLSSGKKSTFYFDAKEVILTPEGSYLAAKVLHDELLDASITAVGGMTAGADPIVSSVGVVSHLAGRRPPLKLFYVRKEPKKHGTQKWIEGPRLVPEDRVLIVEDVVTTGKSILDAIATVRREVGCTIAGAVVLVDRLDEDRSPELDRYGLRAIFTRNDFPRAVAVAADPDAR